MKEGTNPQAGPGWPNTTKRSWRKRDVKGVYHNNPGYSTRRIPSPASPAGSARHNEQFQYQPPSVQTANLGYGDYFTVQRQGSGNQDSDFSNVIHQHSPSLMESSFFSSMSYTLVPNPSDSPRQMFHGNDSQSPISGQPQMFVNDQNILWNGVPSGNSDMGSELDDLNMSDFHFGSFGSFDSMGLQTPDTATSSMHSGEFVFPVTDPTFGPSGTTDPMTGLAIPDEWYKISQASDSSSPGAVDPNPPQYHEDLPLDNGFFQLSEEWNSYGAVYTEDGTQWSLSSTTLIPQQQSQSPQMGESMTLTINPLNPWSSQNAQVSSLQYTATSGNVAFQPPPGSGYETHVKRQEYLDTGQTLTKPFGPDPVTPGESDSDSWALASYVGSYAASHSSPQSHGSPASHPSSPPQDEMEHQHIFSSRPDAPKARLPRGRQRGLTDLEKKQARDVREAKACWACHISKTKCSPCSPGKPCEQCARLAGKRRFCLFSCFNDPLETLSIFLVPDYLNGHFTEANVESFVTRDTFGWGDRYMSVELSWGYRRLIGAEVVDLHLKPNSEMGFHHQTKIIDNMVTRPLLVRKNSPPIGIQLTAMDEMQNEYSRYVQNIVQNDVLGYVRVAYVDQGSKLPERLLAAVCRFYDAGREQDNESDILRRAIEMHVTAVILERSLTLDDKSLRQVQQLFQEEYEEGTAPRCAQRQIKLAFFMVHRTRIMKLLKDWGGMMWSTSSNTSRDDEWATAFTVFLMMILVTDKMLGAAWYFCEGNIAHGRTEANSEQRKFQKLAELTEKELFQRCKEIFHWKFKTRKGGKEACNPIRDGIEAFQSKSKSAPIDGCVKSLVQELRKIAEEFEQEVRSHRSDHNSESKYTDAGRLACIFLDDFLSR